MMNETFLLPLLVLVPLVGAIIGAFVPAKSAKHWSLLVCLATLGVALAIVPRLNFSSGLISDGQGSQLQWGTTTESLGEGITSVGSNRLEFVLAGGKFKFAVLFGMDTISFWLVMLTVVLQPLAVLASYESIKDRPKEYYAWMLALLAAMIGCFVARDLLLFYIFFELTLVPMFFIIGIWGGADRRYAAGKFFLFTFTGSVFTLAAVLYMGVNAGTFEIGELVKYAQSNLSDTERHWILLALLAGFAVKVPLFPVHTWLPLAHTEAPTAGSVILAGVLLKLGTYGLLRIALPLGVIASTGLTASSLVAIKVIAVLCVIGVIYGALVAWVQQDIKKLVAYSSVSHLGFCVLGMVSFTKEGLQGSILYMINHGISTGAMFLVIGMIYDRFHTRDIDALSGLGKKMPKMAFFFVLFVLSSIGLPLTNGFVSEFLTILGAFTSSVLDSKLYGAFAATGVVLGAVYMLHLTARVIFGPLKYPGFSEDPHGQAHGHAHAHDEHHGDVGDLNAREITVLVPLAILVLVLGIAPTFLTKSMDIPLGLITGPAMVASPAEKPHANIATVEDAVTKRE
jgi:NADH-quinone oxidoreductase subunit M